MSRFIPPVCSTAPAAGWLQRIAATACGLLLALAAGSSPAPARDSDVKVLVGTSVAPAAREAMSPGLWAKLIATYVGGETVPFDGAPTLADCRKAGASFAVSAPFALRPQLPAFSDTDGRLAATSRVVVTNCVSGDIVLDRTLTLESEPPYDTSPGDYEGAPEVRWERTVPAELARFPISLGRIPRVVQVVPPFVYLDSVGLHVAPGDTLLDYATAEGHRRKTAFALLVTRYDRKRVEAMFSTVDGNATPHVGDYVEPEPLPSATP